MSGPGFHYEVKRIMQTARGVVCGESHGLARHSDELVEQIRNEYRRYSRDASVAALARKYDISRHTVFCWVTGRRRNVKLTKTVNRRVKVVHE